jgi:predicted porin
VNSYTGNEDAGDFDEFNEDLIDSVLLGESKSHSGYYVDVSFRVYSRKFALVLSGRAKSYEYDVNAFDNSVREDINYRVGGTLDYHVNKSADVFIRTEYTLNNSNMETQESDHNYSLLVNSVGIRLHF